MCMVRRVRGEKLSTKRTRRKMENHLVYMRGWVRGGSEAIYYRETEMMASMGHSLIDTHFYTHTFTCMVI